MGANDNDAGIEYLGDGSSAGTVLGRTATELVAFHAATPVAQASAIVAVTGTVSLTTTINAILTVLRNKGLIAA